MKNNLYLIGLTAAGVFVGAVGYHLVKHYVLNPHVTKPKPVEVTPAVAK